MTFGILVNQCNTTSKSYIEWEIKTVALMRSLRGIYASTCDRANIIATLLVFIWNLIRNNLCSLHWNYAIRCDLMGVKSIVKLTCVTVKNSGNVSIWMALNHRNLLKLRRRQINRCHCALVYSLFFFFSLMKDSWWQRNTKKKKWFQRLGWFVPSIFFEIMEFYGDFFFFVYKHSAIIQAEWNLYSLWREWAEKRVIKQTCRASVHEISMILAKCQNECKRQMHEKEKERQIFLVFMLKLLTCFVSHPKDGFRAHGAQCTRTQGPTVVILSNSIFKCCCLFSVIRRNPELQWQPCVHGRVNTVNGRTWKM